MTWLDDQIAKDRALTRTEALLDEHAPKLYEDLWTELAAIKDEALSKQFPLVASGSGTERTIENGIPRSTFAVTKITISLKNKRTVLISGDVSVSSISRFAMTGLFA
jgi:hypothetical protein